MEKTRILSALDRAIQAEREAHAFYAKAAGETDDPGGAEMFRELAAFERHHEEHLKGLKASLESQAGWIHYPGRKIAKVPAAEAQGRKAAGSHANALDALRIAIGAEERAITEYRTLAAEAPDARGQDMFRKLAEEEELHRKLLDDQYYALTNRGVWIWGD
ncbi:MAG: ferritin family protein [Deferrisomatales bacterium]|nr:ferritin family protein [Deferrisomatales bacterium]